MSTFKKDEEVSRLIAGRTPAAMKTLHRQIATLKTSLVHLGLGIPYLEMKMKFPCDHRCGFSGADDDTTYCRHCGINVLYVTGPTVSHLAPSLAKTETKEN
jgi:hypothetical protein